MEGGFDVYNIETAMPKIDLDAIESHLRAAREEERRVSEYFYIYIYNIIVHPYLVTSSLQDFDQTRKIISSCE